MWFLRPHWRVGIASVNNEEIFTARRLRATSAISDQDEEAIRRLPMTLRTVRADEMIVSDGSRPFECCLIASAFA
jgi:hypothetical protein